MMFQPIQERPSLDTQIVTQYLRYALVSALAFGVPWKLGLKNCNMSFNRYVFWLHGTLTFGLMWLCQPRNLRMIFGDDLDLLAVLQCGIISLLALILWDFGYVHAFYSSWPMMFLVACHHAGLFLAMFIGPGWRIDTLADNDESSRLNLENQISLDTSMFGWLWMTHAFGIFLEIILPYVFRIKVVEGSRSLSFDAMKHVYAVGTVYFYHRYMNYNLDKFFTYQTSSLLVMLVGRYVINSNWKNIDFLRRIEFPGIVIVVIDRVLGFHDNFCQRSLAILVGLCGIFLLYRVVFVELTPMPARYFGPEDNPELKKFLEEETKAVLGVSETAEKLSAVKTKWEKVSKLIWKWWDGKESHDGTKWTQKYPVHVAMSLCKWGDPIDTENFIELLDEIGEKALNPPLTDFNDYVPLHLCAYQYNYEYTLILLQRGADPYIISKDGKCPVEGGLRDKWGLSGTGKPGALGFSDGFWERFNAICLKKSPPKVLSKQEKLYEILKSF